MREKLLAAQLRRLENQIEREEGRWVRLDEACATIQKIVAAQRDYLIRTLINEAPMKLLALGGSFDDIRTYLENVVDRTLDHFRNTPLFTETPADENAKPT